MISVCMATYNGERFIREQMDSVLRQTYQDFEVVICDDCSSDGTLSILQEYSQRDSRIHIYKNEHNLGVVKNFEKAIGLSGGEFVALCDQDDIWTDDHLQYLLDNIGDRELVCGNWFCFEENSDIKEINFVNVKGKNCLFPKNNDDLLTLILFRMNTFLGNSMLIRRRLFSVKNVLPFPNIENICHDWWIEISAIFAHWQTVACAYLKDIITLHRIHEGNVTKSVHSSCFFAKCRSYLFMNKKCTQARIILLQEIKKRFDLLSEQQEVLNRCEVFLIGRNASVFSIKKKFDGLKVFSRNLKHLLPYDERQKTPAKIIRAILKYFQYMFF